MLIFVVQAKVLDEDLAEDSDDEDGVEEDDVRTRSRACASTRKRWASNLLDNLDGICLCPYCALLGWIQCDITPHLHVLFVTTRSICAGWRACDQRGAALPGQGLARHQEQGSIRV